VYLIYMAAGSGQKGAAIMAKKKAKKGQRSAQGDILARQAWEAKAQAMRDGYGAPGQRVWTQGNAKAQASRKACRGKVAAW
jgi:hypothetical protein